MFTYGVADWAGIAGLILPFSVIAYLCLVCMAKILSKIFRYDFNREWPRHWKVICLSFLISPCVVAFWIYKSKEQRFEFDKFLAMGELPSILILGICGALGVLIALGVLGSSKEQSNKSKKL